MIGRHAFRAACATVLVCLALAGTATAQQAPQPTPGAIAAAKEFIELKGASKAFDPIVSGVIEYHKNFLIQTNPNMSRELNEVAAQLRTEYAPKRAELQKDIVRVYAQHFTEQELKEALAFYKSPVGKKLMDEEPKALDDTMKMADQWSAKLAEEVLAKMRSEMKKRGLSPV